MIVGIDYSMTCPALAVHRGGEFNFKNCDIYYQTDKKKYDLTVDNIVGKLQYDWKSPMERFHNNAIWVTSILGKYDGKISHIAIEDYSMNSKGKVFHIAENTGIMKYNLYRYAVDTEVLRIPPAVIKKFATGKGNAKKEMMEEAFIAETGIDLKAILGQTQKQWSPSGDIIDSYYIAKYMWSELQ